VFQKRICLSLDFACIRSQSCLKASEPQNHINKALPGQRAQLETQALKEQAHKHETADTAALQPAQEAAVVHVDRQQSCFIDPQPQLQSPLLSLPPHIISAHVLPNVSLASVHAFLATCKAAHSLSISYLADWLQHEPATALHCAAGLKGAGCEELFLELIERPGLLAASADAGEGTPLLYAASRAGFRKAEQKLLQLGKVSSPACLSNGKLLQGVSFILLLR